MLSRIFRNASVRNAVRKAIQRRSMATEKPQKHHLDGLASKKGWAFETPNLAQYTVHEGSLASIVMRAMIVWNIAMLAYEAIFYPYDLKAVALQEKVE